MDRRFFANPYADYNGEDFEIDKTHVRDLIQNYVLQILRRTSREPSGDRRGDLYVGDAGIAYMFLRLWQSKELGGKTSDIENAVAYIQRAKQNIKENSRSRDQRCAFLCGNAGIYAVSAVIAAAVERIDTTTEDLKEFETGFDACKPVNFSPYGGDEVLVGRAGYLSGVYWLNEHIKPKPFRDEQILEICQSMVESGRQYSKAKRSPIPLMYQYHGTEYLGAAHGVCAILHMLLESPWFPKRGTEVDLSVIPKDHLADIKNSIDAFVALQDSNGNFPCDLDDSVQTAGQNHLVHWCHGAPGAIYLLLKAWSLFKDPKYLNATLRAADCVWQKGLLMKGPGLCHGIAGNGYVFLVLYRLTAEPKYLWRALKFMEFLTNIDFIRSARLPDCPFSLYEGLAGTVCYLVDLLDPQNAEFPFMKVS